MDNIANLPSLPNGLSTEVLSKLQALINLIRSDHGTDELPELLMGHLVDLFRPDRADYYVKEPFNAGYRMAASSDKEVRQERTAREMFQIWPNKNKAIMRAIDRKEIVFGQAPSVAESDDEDASVETAGEIVVPILSRGPFDLEEKVVVAVIVMSRGRGEEFHREEYQLLNIVASLISTAYNNSLAKTLKEKHIDFLASILSVQTDDLDLVFKNFFVAVTRLVPSKFLALWLYNELDNKLVVRSLYPPEIGRTTVSFESLDRLVLDCDSCLSGEVIKTKRPKVFTQIDVDDKFINPNFARLHDIDWFIGIPILDSNKNPLGVVSLAPFGKPEEFSQGALEALSRYIAPLANTIRLTSLLNEESLLFAFDDFFQNMLDFQDQQASWDSLAILIRRQIMCAACSIFLIEADGNLHLKGTTGIIGNPPYEAVYYSTEQGLTGKAFTSGEPIIYYQEDKERYEGTHISRYRENIPGKSKSIIMMPIMDKNNCPIGVIRCNNKEEALSQHIGRFTKEDKLHLQKISKIIANAHSRTLWLKEKEKERERGMNSMNHEILSPLDAITSHIEWMRYNFSQWKNPTDWEKDRVLLKLDDMEQNLKLIDVVVTTLGRFDESIKFKTREVSLLHLINTCRGFMQNEARRKQIDIIVDTIYVLKIRCDELQLMRVFYNLLRNAVKYSDHKERKKSIRIYIEDQQPEYFLLSFADNGIGVIPGEEERIFQKYERGSNAAKCFPEGSGLGLAFCRSIMERHGGKIYVTKDSLSKPTVFHLKFPKWMRISQ
jgi:signal transduction histidine kinase